MSFRRALCWGRLKIGATLAIFSAIDRGSLSAGGGHYFPGCKSGLMKESTASGAASPAATPNATVSSPTILADRIRVRSPLLDDSASFGASESRHVRRRLGTLLWEISSGGRRKPGLAGDLFWGSLVAMTREELLQRIWIDPGRCSGQPCIRGHRIWVSLILDLLAAGESVETILEDYPGISREDVQACIAYGSEMARERFVEIPLEPAGA